MMRIRGIIKAMVVFLISLVGFLMLVFVFINLPFSHRFVTQKINNILSSSRLPIHINSVNKVFPWAIYVQGILIHGSQGDTIVYAGKVRSGFEPLALIKKRLILKSVYLEKATINFLRNPGEEQLNIATAFSPVKEAKPVDPDVKKKPLEISIADVEVKDLKFRMTDSVAGIYVSQDIVRIKVVTNKMSLIEKTIIARSLEIDGATGNMTLNRKTDGESKESGAPWNFGIKELNAGNINFVFDDPAGKQKLDLLAGEIEIKTRQTDINKKIIDFDKISISRTSAVLHIDNQSENRGKTKPAKSDSDGWDIRGDMINLQDVACQIIKYSDTAVYNQLSGFSVIGLGMRLSDLQFNKADLKADIENMKFDLGNGLSIKDLNGGIDSHSETTRINLVVETANSRLNFDGMADGYIFDILKNPERIHNGSLALKKTGISLTDIFYFKPDLRKIPGINSLIASPVSIEGNMKLNSAQLTLPSFSVSQSNSLTVSFKGKIDNVFDPRNTMCDVEFSINKITSHWLREISKEIKPDFILPDFKELSIIGSVSDSLRSPDFTVNLKSDLGKLDLLGSFDFGHDKFSFRSCAANLMAGKILNSQTFGSFSGTGEISGSGITGKSLNAVAVLKVDSFRVMNYVYKNFEIGCKIKPGEYDLKVNVSDPSLKLDINAGLKAEGSLLSVNFSGKIVADLYKLHLYKDSLFIEGNMSGDLMKNHEEMSADLSLSEIGIASPDDSVKIHTITSSFESDSLNTNIVAGADFFSASAHINRSAKGCGQFVDAYREYLRSLINSPHADSIRQALYLPLMNGKIKLEYTKALRIFFPDSTLYFKNLSFSFNTDIAENKINYGLLGSGVKYKLLEIGNINASIADSAATFDWNLVADTCLIRQQQINRIHIKTHFFDWKSLTSLSVIDKQSKLNYNFEIRTVKDSNNILLEFPSRQMILNAVIWNMDSPEFLKYDLKTKVISPSVRMHTDSSSISFLSDEQDGWQNFYLTLNNVALSSFLKSELLPGKPHFLISGSSTYSRNADLGKKIAADLKFNNVTWSDLFYKKLSVNGFFLSDTTNNFNFDFNTRFDTSEIKIWGLKKDKSNRNISAQFNRIPVNTVQPFVTKYLSDLRGTISGEVGISNKDDVRSLSGDLLISDGNLKIKTLNSSYRLPEDRINFTGKKMEFSNFKILDSLNNELIIDGFLDFAKKSHVYADLGIASSNLQILNRKEDKDATFYGDIFMDSKLSIKGAVTSPVLRGKITLAKGTDIYFRQSENLDLSESGNVVTFESRKPSPGQTGKKTESGSSIYNKSSVESVVEIDPATRINIEISKKMFNIDMTIQGGGELNYNMLVNSQVNMTGRYEISEGRANLKMVGWPNKAFSLTKGGFIRWDGKLDDPDLKLEAINRVKSSYINPVDNKERYVDFDVTLKISNRLSSMDVSFTINTPDQYLMSIINTMSPDEQMRQAITILLFEYIDLPGISTSSNYMTEQVNQMVAAQLNSLTKTTIKGIDISFGIDTYTQGTSTGGQQTKTSLSYEVKKNLLNDRAKVELSGIASGTSNQSGSANTSLNNFSFEYRIDSAATKFLKVYNEHSYEDVFEGDVVKTGIGFTYRKNYPSLSDIWRKEKKISQSKNPDK
jgi:translocation and assembly module TamB